MKICDAIPFKYQISESNAEGPLRVRGIFQRADEKNANGRVYPRKLWEKILSSQDIAETVERRRMIGEIDHPIESEMKLSRAALIITGLNLNENSEIVGEFEVLPTEHGKHLESLLKAGVECGISSRGEGSTFQKEGIEYIADDYRLMTFDVVASPSTRGAFPKVVQESAQLTETEEDKTMKFDEVQSKVQQITRVNLSETTGNQRAEILSSIPTLIESLDRAVIDDPGYKSLAEGLVEELRDVKKTLESKSVPPTVEAKSDAAAQVVDEVVRQASGLVKLEKIKRAKVVKIFKTKLAETAKKNKELAEENAVLRSKYAASIAGGEKLFEGFKKVSAELKKMKAEGVKKTVPASVVERKSSTRVSRLVEDLATSAANRRPILKDRSESINESSDPIFSKMESQLGLRY